MYLFSSDLSFSVKWGMGTKTKPNQTDYLKVLIYWVPVLLLPIYGTLNVGVIDCFFLLNPSYKGVKSAMMVKEKMLKADKCVTLT